MPNSELTKLHKQHYPHQKSKFRKVNNMSQQQKNAV